MSIDYIHEYYILLIQFHQIRSNSVAEETDCSCLGKSNNESSRLIVEALLQVMVVSGCVYDIKQTS